MSIIKVMGNVLRKNKEATETMYNPMVKQWELYFDVANGYENRYDVMKAFASFWEDSKADKLEIPGKCRFGGEVFGHKGYSDGVVIVTSSIQSVERIERGYHHNGLPHDLMCATTTSGSKYYFYSSDCNVFMYSMMTDSKYADGELRSYLYLRPEFRDSKFIV